jgi:hypothetical protein
LEFDYGDGNNVVNGGTGSAAGDGFVGSFNDSNPVMIYRRLLARREYTNAAAQTSLASTTSFAVSYGADTTTETDMVEDPSGMCLPRQCTRTMETRRTLSP